MIRKGIGASEGIAIGKVHIKRELRIHVDDRKAVNVEEELKKIEDAISKAREEVEVLKYRTAITLGEEEAKVFDAHILILEDPEFMGLVEYEIETTGVNAMKALEVATQRFISLFDSMDNEYMRERSMDISDISARIMRKLAGLEEKPEILCDDAIVVSRDLAPSDTASLDRSKVKAFVTETGGKTSHSAIMARTLEIPAVVGLGSIMSYMKNGDDIIVDGNEGLIIINPDYGTKEEYREKRKRYIEEKKALSKLKNIESVTLDGKRVEVSGNIGKPSDVEAILEKGGDGIGLFRTEFLYMDRAALPSEREQFEEYRKVLEKMGDKPVIVRTMDIGGDKKLAYLNFPEEMNPFLGYRGIRVSLDRPEVFKVQLRALLKASAYGNMKIMFPMVSSLKEYQDAMKIVEEVRNELRSRNIPFDENMEFGIMIELPAAALISDELAKECDFFSIGTNDLIQYTIAVDRMSEKVSYLYNPDHPAVLSLIEMTIRNAHKNGIWCGMCGEMAGDGKTTDKLLKMGLDEFSMSASSILEVKKAITEGYSDRYQGK